MAMYARPIAQLLLGEDPNASNGCREPDRPAGLLGLTGWPIGAVIDGDQNLIDELANVYGIRFVKAQRQAEYKFGAIELVNGDLVDGRIKILKGSPLEKQATILQWKPDDFGNQREDKAQANHSTDTLIGARKLIATLFDTGAVVQEAKPSADRAPPVVAFSEPVRPGIPTPRETDPYSDLLPVEDYADLDWG
jgi:hypothetical protein